MASLKALSFTSKYPTSICNSSSKRSVKAVAINIPSRLARVSLPVEPLMEKQLSPAKMINTVVKNGNGGRPDPTVVAKLYAILEAVSDRIEMHENVGEQRNNWNSLLLTSINSMTLTAAIMAAIAAAGGGAPVRIGSTFLYVAATGMLSVMNQIQPSQLAEEQRNAARLFKQIRNQIQTMIAIGNPTAVDAREMMEKVLALDKAYPLPLLGGAMLEKFPPAVEPAVWWPERRRRRSNQNAREHNGWSAKLEEEMREIVKILKSKDKKDYLRLGEKARKLNKYLAIAGPTLTSTAAVGSALLGHGAWAAAAAAVMGGALASVVNALQHGGQVGMVFEMYRSNAGFFEMVEELIESNLKEEDLQRRENGEVFEMKVALMLGRSLSELRDLATAAAAGEEVCEFGSKLF